MFYTISSRFKAALSQETRISGLVVTALEERRNRADWKFSESKDVHTWPRHQDKRSLSQDANKQASLLLGMCHRPVEFSPTAGHWLHHHRVQEAPQENNTCIDRLQGLGARYAVGLGHIYFDCFTDDCHQMAFCKRSHLIIIFPSTHERYTHAGWVLRRSSLVHQHGVMLPPRALITNFVQVDAVATSFWSKDLYTLKFW